MARLVAAGAGGHARLSARTTLVRLPFEVSPQEPIAALVRDRAAARLGREPDVRGHSAWMDAAFTSAAGIPTVVFGPDGAGARGRGMGPRRRARLHRGPAGDRARLLRLTGMGSAAAGTGASAPVPAEPGEERSAAAEGGGASRGSARGETVRCSHARRDRGQRAADSGDAARFAGARVAHAGGLMGEDDVQ